MVNTSDSTDSPSESSMTFGGVLAMSFFLITVSGVYPTCPLSRFPLIKLSVNSPKSCDVDVFRVLAYLTADQVLMPPLVVEKVDFRILMSNLVPFGMESSPV